MPHKYSSQQGGRWNLSAAKTPRSQLVRVPRCVSRCLESSAQLLCGRVWIFFPRNWKLKPQGTLQSTLRSELCSGSCSPSISLREIIMDRETPAQAGRRQKYAMMNLPLFDIPLSIVLNSSIPNSFSEIGLFGSSYLSALLSGCCLQWFCGKEEDVYQLVVGTKRGRPLIPTIDKEGHTHSPE